jgi:hypothetical protein
MGGQEQAGGVARLGVAVTAPQFLVVALVMIGAATAGHGWSLVLLLGIATVGSAIVAWLAWSLLLRVRRPPGVLLGALVGLLVGCAAAALSFAAAAADKHIGPRFGGSLLGEMAGGAFQAGMEQGAQLAPRTGMPVLDVAGAPARAVTSIAGGFLALMMMAAVFLGAIALPIVTGLVGGIAAALAERRRLD